MDGVNNLPLFMAAALLLNLTPGADMLLVIGSSASQGRRAGLMAALGVGAGCLVHVLLAAFGLTALLATSELAFVAVKWLGAAYLVWMGVAMWRQAGAAPRSVPRPLPRPPSAWFWQGALTNALNPKVALFFMAFLPQFVSAEPSGSHALAFVALGLMFATSGTVVNMLVALLANALARKMAGPASAGRQWAGALQRGAAMLFVGLGVKLALSSR
jgi:threonine/homoserine/homoserine lactone efflux protein